MTDDDDDDDDDDDGGKQTNKSMFGEVRIYVIIVDRTVASFFWSG